MFSHWVLFKLWRISALLHRVNVKSQYSGRSDVFQSCVTSNLPTTRSKNPEYHESNVQVRLKPIFRRPLSAASDQADGIVKRVIWKQLGLRAINCQQQDGSIILLARSSKVDKTNRILLQENIMQIRRKFKDILYRSPRLGSELRTFLQVSANSFSVVAITDSEGEGDMEKPASRHAESSDLVGQWQHHFNPLGQSASLSTQSVQYDWRFLTSRLSAAGKLMTVNTTWILS